MSLLRILRNLAVLVILTVGGLGLTPRLAMAKKKPPPPLCTPQGHTCPGSLPPCCPGLQCVSYGGNLSYCDPL
jgi:hypothetical protein